MSDRGDYRSFYVSMLDDPDFRDMPGDDFKLLFALRLTLGAAGVGLLRRLVLADQLKITTRQLEKRLANLENPKPDTELGWIVWDRRTGIIWIVNALKYEPSLSSKNLNQRKFIHGLLKPLSPHSKAVQGFWKQYPDWQSEPETDPDPDSHGQGDTPTPPDGVGMGSEGGQKHKRLATSDSDKQQATITSDKRPESGPLRPRDRFFAKFYATATADRRSEIGRQLDQLLEPEGLRVSRRLVVRANSLDHLNRAISDVLRGVPIRNPDRAIMVLFRKLGDAEKNGAGETPGEAVAHREKEQRALEDRYHAAAKNAGLAWASTNRPEYEKIITQLETRYRDQTNSFAQIAKDTERVQKCANAAGFPDFETWLEEQKVTA